ALPICHVGRTVVKLAARVGVVVARARGQAAQFDEPDRLARSGLPPAAPGDQHRLLTGGAQAPAQFDRRDHMSGLRPHHHCHTHALTLATRGSCTAQPTTNSSSAVTGPSKPGRGAVVASTWALAWSRTGASDSASR